MRRILVLLVLLPASLTAQGYRLRLDVRSQVVAYRGVAVDSLPVSDTVPGVGGGPVTPDGIAVQCVAGQPYCSFFRPGPTQRSGPVSTAADFTAWGLGIPGLSVHMLARGDADLGNAAVSWPSTAPALQLLEGYAEFARPAYLVRLGRQTQAAPIGFTGFDGASATVRREQMGVDATAYLGWGLADASALPVTSAALNPLDDFQPVERQLVAGGSVGFRSMPLDLHWSYERQVDRRSQYFVSERTRGDAVVRPLAGWTLTASGMYDLAQSLWGNVDLRLAWRPASGFAGASLGVSRYRPDFDLWTIWGVFSPTAYRSIDGTVDLAPARGLSFHVTGQAYQYDATGASAPLTNFENSGWRFSWDGVYAVSRRWTLDAGYRAEFGPGASSRGFTGGATFTVTDQLTLSAHAGTLDRPLEFRLDDASVWMVGAAATWKASDRWNVQADATQYTESRRRPDTAGFDWNQTRISARLVLLFGSEVHAGLPAAVQAMPEAPR
ncbi:MAG TPA: hypothetical protein VJN62_15895 [Gemmatimonadales bacterium]|nr:hypothetical protein [Gemmatimonadales bacterium]